MATPKEMTEASDALAAYRAKRDGGRTPEPLGSLDTRAGVGCFVVHEHKASRHHFDLRLELGGVLQSWAIPKPPSLNPDDKRLAIKVEDHPVEYAHFEAVIPPGNYGAGPMIVWDRGAFLPVDNPVDGLANGEIKFALGGYKLRGAFTIVKTKGRGRSGNEWLLIKKRDEFATPEPLPMASVLSGLLVDELVTGSARVTNLRKTLASAGLPAWSQQLATVSPMLAELAEPFSDPNWLYEIKYDGYRLLAEGGMGTARLRYRSGRDATHVFPELAASLRSLPIPVVIDGEVVVLGEDGTAMFAALAERAMLSKASQREQAALIAPVTYFAFDVLAVDGVDVRSRPLSERKLLAAGVLPALGPLRFAGHVDGAGEAMFAKLVELGQEGMVAKRMDSTYQGGRSAAWRKVKRTHVAAFYVCGVTPPEGQRVGFGALHLCVKTDGGYVYAGKVGSGFTEGSLSEWSARLGACADWRPTFDVPADSAGTRWIAPTLLVDVRFAEWSHAGHLRFPVFIGSSERDGAAALDELPDEQSEPPQLPEPERQVTLSNPDKIFFPALHVTKRDVFAYYRDIAPRMLPYLVDRPAVLTRFPDGIDGKSFYQKDLPSWAPDWVRTTRLWSESSQREVHYVLIDHVETLEFLANLGTIPIHVWGSRATDLGRPDWTILDLDPKHANPADVAPIALAIHELCEELAIPHYVKTSGQSGYHILIPLGAAYTFEQARSFAYLLAHIVELRLPTIATTNKNPRDRGGRVFIDWGQNAHGQLLAAPYAVRAVPSAALSWPISWDEVAAGLPPQGVTLENYRSRAQAPDLMLPLLTTRMDLRDIIQRLQDRITQ